MKKECWCPVCGQYRMAGKIRWLWFLIFLLLLRAGVILYLLYCLLCSKRVCEVCHRRKAYVVKGITPKEKFGGEN